MASNRKHGSAAMRFAPLLKACLLVLFLGGSGVGYVWQKDQINRLGTQVKAREQRLEQLINENEQRRKQLGKLRSPAELEVQIKKLNLGLGPPQPGQVVRLPEPLLEPGPAAAGPHQYAAGDRGPDSLQ